MRVLGTSEPAHFAALARRERPHLLALDAHSEDNAAWRVMSALQTDPGTAAIPLLLFAREDPEAERSLDLGMLTLIGKPLSIEEATARVRSSLQGEEEATIVVADDDPHVRRILGEALSAAGCDVRAASSGGELLDLARRLHPHTVVVDLLMPGMNGIEAIALMRAEPALAQIRVIALANREMPEEDMTELTQAIAALERGHRARTRATAELVRHAVDRVGAGSTRNGAAGRSG
jgi:CheY-like chemotaxis protein